MATTARINGRYRIVRQLGDGAQGTVLLVADERQGGAQRALKVVAGMHEDQRQRLAGEFGRLASLDHPRLVRVHDLDVVAGEDAGLAPGTPFFTADYIAGHNPITALARCQGKLALTLIMAEDIAAALAHVHAAGLVHCDVKPANIMVQDPDGPAPRAMLLDLGLSTARGITGQARGTLAYMSREALAGAVDPRSDLYALGATLVHAITGAPPFAASSPQALIRAICDDPVPPITAPWLPEPLAGCIMRLLCRDPGDRHSSAQVLLDDLARIREALGMTTPEPRTTTPPGRQANTRRTPAALLPPRLIGRDATVAALLHAMDSLARSHAAREPHLAPHLAPHFAPHFDEHFDNHIDSPIESPSDGRAGMARPVRLVRLMGAPGSGRTAIIAAVVRARQLAVAGRWAAPLTFVRGTVDQLGHALGMDDPALDQAPGQAAMDDQPEAHTPLHPDAADAERAQASAEASLHWANALLERAARMAPAVLIIAEDPGEASGDTRRQALLRAALAGHPAFDHGLLLIATTPPEPAAGHHAGADALPGGTDAMDSRHIRDIAVPPLTADEVHALAESMVGRSMDPAWTRELTRASGGLPRLVVEAVRAAAARAGIDRVEHVAVAELMSTADDLAHLVVSRAARLPAELAGVLEALAVHDGAASAHTLAATLEREVTRIYAALAELRSAGFVVDPGDGPGDRQARTEHELARLPSPAHTRALHQAIPETRRKALHRAALAVCEAGEAVDPIARARHLIETGPLGRAAAACAQAARLLWARGELDRAHVMSRHAVDLAQGPAAADACILLARIATAAGHYDEAVSAAERAARSRAPARQRQARFALARALQKRGDLDAAEAVLRELVAEARNEARDEARNEARDEARNEARAEARNEARDLAIHDATPGSASDGHEAALGAYARLLVARGRHAQALAVAGEPEIEPPLFGPIGPGRALRLESAGLARLYQGDLDGADAAFARLEAAARAAASDRSDRALCGRALSLRGMVDHSRGNIAGAAERYRQAGIEARAAGEVHAAAVYNLNQATAHSERGRFGAALEATGAALAELTRLGDVAELAAAWYNRGIALLALGEIAAAGRAAAAALREARTAQMTIYATLLGGDVHRRQGDTAAARAAYERARDHSRDHGCARELLMCLLNLAEILAQDNDGRAAEILAQAADQARSADDRDRLTVSRARVALSLGVDADGQPLEQAGALLAATRDTSRRALDSGRIDQAWRGELLAARLCRARAASGDATDDAKRHLRQARALYEDMLADTPESHRDGLRGDPDACALAALAAELGLRPGPGATLDSNPMAGVHSPGELRRLLALSRRLNSQLSLEPLLDDVMDTAIEMTAAERGFLLLRQGAGLELVVARNFDQTTLRGDDDDNLMVSRSIAERAATTGEVVLTVDAAIDDRFGAAESVAALRLRSVLAVPLRQKGQVTGTIYVDHRFRRSAFADHAIELVQELADIAAVAIENARLVEESRRRQDEIVALNRRLQAEVVEKEAELLRVRMSGGEPAGLRHEYPAIAGRSPAMLAMLRLMDRITETHLPVVIHGESGTGKELVARALHDNGPRRQGPFVPVNCGAVPEHLLESELFGHVRGAFTGADRDRRGLFEVAHGGTLLLDEVADTSLAMQTKLLRVLQEGEIRRVGEARPRAVDVRVIAASNRRLDDLVATGEFREDLFYRLNVLRIDVPPLRERAQDIPMLVEHLLARLAPGREPPAVTRGAMARLCSYSWPGNVRELENQLARAMALGGDVIDVAALSPHVQTAGAAGPAAHRRAGNLAGAAIEDVTAGATDEPGEDMTGDLTLKPRLEALERRLIEEAMRRSEGNQTAAAKLLGMSRYGLQKKLRRYGIAGSRPE